MTLKLLERSSLLAIANKWWPEILSNAIVNRTVFPKFIEIPIPKPIDIKIKHTLIQNNQQMLHELSQENRNFRAESTLVNYRDSGSQNLITAIHFDTLEQYLYFSGNSKKHRIFTQLVDSILASIPQLISPLQKDPSLVLENEDLWPEILKVLQFFLQNPKPMVYMRALPINVHTKFIEENKRLLDQLLISILPENSFYLECSGLSNYGFEKRFSLLYEKKLIRMKLLDEQLYIQSTLSDITALPSEIDKLKIPCKNIFIVENKMTFLSFPPINTSLVFFGSGYSVSDLKDISWLEGKNIFYWGDLDAQGFEILSQLRHYYPNAQSILMTEEIYQKYQLFSVPGTPSNISASLNLTQTEQKLYETLKRNSQRLEQERIPHIELLNILKTL